ncbi:Mobile element protein [Pseudomonas synxantha]|uniref:Mobile element protein n=1 Tax=Pseudomonas synxantha TaxID=47883 RepID=A0A3G7UBX5_9PSED|nr:Mobile element protein [Pseudomonas synxantha]
MEQLTFADAEYAGKRKETRKEWFLTEMDKVVPWKGLIALIEPYFPNGEGGRPAYPLMVILHVHPMLNWFDYCDPAMEETLYEATILRQKHELASGVLRCDQ